MFVGFITLIQHFRVCKIIQGSSPGKDLQRCLLLHQLLHVSCARADTLRVLPRKSRLLHTAEHHASLSRTCIFSPEPSHTQDHTTLFKKRVFVSRTHQPCRRQAPSTSSLIKPRIRDFHPYPHFGATASHERQKHENDFWLLPCTWKSRANRRFCKREKAETFEINPLLARTDAFLRGFVVT